MRQFVLQAMDPEMNCPFLEARFVAGDLSALRGILGRDADHDQDLHHLYPLNTDQLASIVQIYGVPFAPGDRTTILEPWHAMRAVPYLVHTNFELPLMLDGRKPLAVFSGTCPSEWFDNEMAKFAPYVAEGLFVRRLVSRPFPEPYHLPDGPSSDEIREVYFAVCGQEWRIDAFLMLRDIAAKSGWNDALERFEGSLLGYEDWQNDWWIKNRRCIHEGTTESP
jgi:hypothetical protein